MSFLNRKPKLFPVERLRLAVKESDTLTLREVLADAPELLNYQDDKKSTPLHWAAEQQDLSIVAALLDLGADANSMDTFGNTPRDIAFVFGEFRMGAYTEVCQRIVNRLDESARGA